MSEYRPLLNAEFPIRTDVSAWVQVPRDLTTKEADRLAAMIRMLAPPDSAVPNPAEEDRGALPTSGSE